MLSFIILENVYSKYIDEIDDIIFKWQNKHIKDNIINGISSQSFPITIVLSKDKILVGFYQIVDNDTKNSYLSPWIANVFIKEEFRNNGYGKMLINSIPKFMQKYNIKDIYLHTRLINFYEKFGWKKLEELKSDDNIKRNIYKLSI